jgi:hypothetical protein
MTLQYSNDDGIAHGRLALELTTTETGDSVVQVARERLGDATE